MFPHLPWRESISSSEFPLCLFVPKGRFSVLFILNLWGFYHIVSRLKCYFKWMLNTDMADFWEFEKVSKLTLFLAGHGDVYFLGGEQWRRSWYLTHICSQQRLHAVQLAKGPVDLRPRFQYHILHLWKRMQPRRMKGLWLQVTHRSRESQTENSNFRAPSTDFFSIILLHMIMIWGARTAQGK